MTELDRIQIVESMFPDWKGHLSDGKLIDQILEGLTCQRLVLKRCCRPSCNNVARRGRKTCMECAAKAAQYMRNYGRRQAMNAKEVATVEADAGRQPDGVLTTQLVM